MKLNLRQPVFACALIAFTILSAAAAAQDAAAGLDPALLAKAKAGDPSSEYLVAIEYQKGDIVPRDFVQAAAWLRKAADQGYAGAQAALALCYAQGAGITQDNAQALALYQKAVAQND